MIAVHQASILLIVHISFVWTSSIHKDRQFDSSLLSTTAARTSSSETLRVILQRLSPCWELICSIPWSLRVLQAAKTSPLVSGQKATCTHKQIQHCRTQKLKLNLVAASVVDQKTPTACIMASWDWLLHRLQLKVTWPATLIVSSTA